MAARVESGQTANFVTKTETAFKEWLKIASLLVIVLGGLFGVIFGATTLAIAPVQSDIQSMKKQLDRLEDETKAAHREIAATRQDMNNEFKAVRKDISDLSERLTRVETILEGGGHRTGLMMVTYQR